MRSVYFTPQGLAGILCSRAEAYTLLGRGERALADLGQGLAQKDGRGKGFLKLFREQRRAFILLDFL